jgi:hypothetical protein|tara:strand:+ start:3021 stop:3203 length:183 start_codon:yes stop_codon:yes gene_type:complete
MIHKEKDPTINKLASDVFSKLADLSKPDKDEKPSSESLKFVSPEDAIKELLDIDQTSDNT